MKANTLEIELGHWPYALEVQLSKEGLLLRPRFKARAGWGKAFRSRRGSPDFAEVRKISNAFDEKEWQW